MRGRLGAFFADRAKRFVRDEAGSIVIMAGAFISVLVCVAIIAVDLGSLYLDRRKTQGAVDLAAIIAAQALDRAEATVRQVLADNGIGEIDALALTFGRYEPDETIAPGLRFTAAATPPNAVHVALEKRAPLFFAARMLPESFMRVGVRATGARLDMAAFSIGSRLASLNGGVVNALTGALLGTNVSIALADYQALAAAKIDVFDFLDALATEADLTAATYDEVLNHSVTTPQILAAASDTLGAGASAGARRAMDAMAAAAAGSPRSVELGGLIDPGVAGGTEVGGAGTGFAVSTSVLSLLSAAAVVAGGSNQVALALGASIPGVSSATLFLSIGERPATSKWMTVGGVDSVVHTAQIRVGLRVSIAGSGVLQHVSINLPILVEAAEAEARLSAMTCDGAVATQVDIAARPGVIDAWIGDLTPFTLQLMSNPASVHDAELLRILALTIRGRAHVEIADQTPTILRFSAADIENGTLKTVSTSTAAESLVGSLFDDLLLSLGGSSLGVLGASEFGSTIRSQLDGLAASLDNVLFGALEVLGIRIGEADVWVNGARCGRPGLVG